MDPTPFWSARRRLARADKHINDFEAAANSYFDSQPFKTIAQVDLDRLHVFHKLLFLNPIPDIITDCAFDAISNLRASLDNAAYTIALYHAPTLADKVYFPIPDTAPYLEALLTERRFPYRKAFPTDIHSFLRRVEPYKRGSGHSIWALNRVRRQAEHRLLIHCARTADFKLQSANLAPGAEFQFFEHVDGSEDEIVFAISPIGSQFEYEVDFTTNITFGDGVDAAAGTSVGTFLKTVRDKVAETLDGIETEARRIRLI